MPALPDLRSLSPESLELWHSLVVRAVGDLGMCQVDASTSYGISPHTVSQWISLYREQGEDGLEVKPQGRPQGAGRALTPEQEHEMRTLVMDSTPHQQQIASATWARQAVAELIASRFDIKLTVQGVGKYLRRWGLTPQKPAYQVREQDPEAVRELVEQKLPAVQEQAEAEDAQLPCLDERGQSSGSDRHPAHEAQAVEPWLEGREGAIELHWLPRNAPEYTPDECLNHDLKQELENEPMPESTSELRAMVDSILARIASMSDRLRGYFKQASIDFELS